MAQRIGILTAGGDAPGLNAAIRGFGKAAIQQHGWELIGFRDGMRGLAENRFTELDPAALSGILTTGGTMLGTSRDKVHRMMVDGEPRDMVPTIVENCEKDGIDALVCLGGGGTAKNAKRLMDAGLNVIHLPKTIDNDIVETETSFGFGDGEEPNFPTRVGLTRLAGMTVLNTYVPQGKSVDHPDYEVKKRFLERVRGLILREMEGPFLWVGDLNVAPTDADVTHPENKRGHVCFCHDIQERFARTSEGLKDLLRVFRPDPGEFTFFDYRVKDALTRNIGWRIDHALASPSLALQATDCFVEREPRGWERPSDHTPLVVDFALP